MCIFKSAQAYRGLEPLASIQECMFFFFSYMIELLSIFFLTVQEILTSTLGLSKERGASSKSVLKSAHHPALPQKDIYDQTIFV